jgi:hypothetical protein
MCKQFSLELDEFKLIAEEEFGATLEEDLSVSGPA